MNKSLPGVGALREERDLLWTRRQVLLGAVGGSLALLFGTRALAEADEAAAWPLIEQVQQRLFPDEAEAPGAQAINALGYLQKVLRDDPVARRDRDFILQGVVWLQDLSQQREGRSFGELDAEAQNQLLAQIAQSRAGQNWLSTLLTYIFEALLTAPAYGGNPGGVGWKWLRYVPGFPLAQNETLYWKLPQ